MPDEPLVEPLDAADPRFAGADGPSVPPHARTLVASRGPGAQPEDPRVRVLRIAVPLLFAAAVVTIAAVFFAGLAIEQPIVVVGPLESVQATVASRPRLVCVNDNNPCAWLTIVDGELLALNSNGTLPDEFGRQGVAWCPSSGYFGSNVTGSRYDAAGRVVSGPAPRGLDLVELRLDRAGRVVVDFSSFTTNRQAKRGADTIPPTGADCGHIPFDPGAFWPLG